MSIPISFSVDIVGKAVLKDEAVLEMLKVVEEKDNLFASSPIGATMQDGGKRKRSDGDYHTPSSKFKIKKINNKNKINQVSHLQL